MTVFNIRLARPVRDLARSTAQYSEGLGLKLLGQFTDHQGFSGNMLGMAGLPWHLEFTVH